MFWPYSIFIGNKCMLSIPVETIVRMTKGHSYNKMCQKKNGPQNYRISDVIEDQQDNVIHGQNENEKHTPFRGK